MQTMPPIIELMEEIVLSYWAETEHMLVNTGPLLLPDDPAERALFLEAQEQATALIDGAAEVMENYFQAGEAYKKAYDKVYSGKLVPLALPPALQQAEADYMMALACAVACVDALSQLEDTPIFEEEEIDAFRKQLHDQGIDTKDLWLEQDL